MPAAELIHDDGVLETSPLLELGGHGGARTTGGTAVLPWRRDWLEATRLGVAAVDSIESLGDERYAQALVHLQKSRDATWLDLHAAWERLEPGGRLLLCGGNELGVVSAVKRLARELDQKPIVLANRRRARIVLFRREVRGLAPERPAPREVPLPVPAGASGGDAADGGIRGLRAAPGVFSARRLDVGTELLLSVLPDERPPRRVLDLGCGIGALGIAALLRWPGASALLLDGDARAVADARHNAAALGVAARCEVVWWDALEPCPDQGFDLVLLNPPFHTGKDVDLAPARAMFERLSEALAPGGHALVVANRTLPYERDLAARGELTSLRETRGYKVLSLCRRSRSEASRRRYSPGARSGGSS